jgi:hypothetical protein
MHSEFDTRAHADKAEWLEYSKKLKSLEQAAKQDPARAALEMEEIAHDDYRHWQSVLRNRFGIDWRLPGRARVIHPERLPRKLHEHYDYSNTAKACATWGGAWIAMHTALKRARRDEEDSAQAALRAFFRVLKHTPALFGCDIGLDEDHEAMRFRAMASLVGFVDSKLSNTAYRRRNRTLNRGEQSESLAASVRLAWEERLPEEPVYPGTGENNLVSRVDKLLEMLGSEADGLSKLDDNVDNPRRRVRTLTPLPPEEMDVTGQEDQGIAEFERRETLLQQLRQLEGWVEAAKFSEREAQVYELDMRTDHDTAAVARWLGIDNATVRQYRARYRDKLCRVAHF